MSKDYEIYLKMQQKEYEKMAQDSSFEEGIVRKDLVVNSWGNHDSSPLYDEMLFKYYKPDKRHIALDYGCGPGRLMRRYHDKFMALHGVDISLANLKNARIYIGENVENVTFWQTEGDEIPNKFRYDFIYSVICMQHIPVHSIRYAILRSMYGHLKPGGQICIQMAVGRSNIGRATATYFEDIVLAEKTNGEHDVFIITPELEIQQDLEDLKFKEIKWELTAPISDHHPQWIWIYAKRGLK